MSRTYFVTAVRTSVYEVEADSREHAIDAMLAGDGSLVDETTDDVYADEQLDSRPARTADASADQLSDASEDAMNSWARAYDDLNGAPENEEDR